MSYIKQEWTTGDKITAEKLNHMEDGIENASSGSSELLLYWKEDQYGHTFFLDEECTNVAFTTKNNLESDSQAIQEFNNITTLINNYDSVYVSKIEDYDGPVHYDRRGPVRFSMDLQGYGDEGPNAIYIVMYIPGHDDPPIYVISWNSYD